MYYFLSILSTVISPYMLNPTEGDLKGKATFPAAVFTALLVVWTYFRLPETKGLDARDARSFVLRGCAGEEV